MSDIMYQELLDACRPFYGFENNVSSPNKGLLLQPLSPRLEDFLNLPTRQRIELDLSYGRVTPEDPEEKAEEHTPRKVSKFKKHKLKLKNYRVKGKQTRRIKVEP